MSHEIRTPLNCILGLSSLLKDSDLSESQADSMGMIVTSGKLLQCVVDDVLDYSKLESGSADVQIDTADLQEIVSDLINSMLSSTTATKRNITIRTFIEPGVSRTIDTDGRRLLQILFNLLSNAVKFSRSNGVVDFFLATDNNVVRFVVKDYGKGIARKEFESIFQPFTQSTTGIANIYGGTGLGLAITKKLVEALGGTISVDSRIAKWTEFTLDLPCNCPPICVESLSTRLKAARIYFVSSGETTLSDQMAAIFYRFNVPFTRFSSMNEIIQTEKSREASASDNSFVCMVQGDLVDRKAFDRACQNGKMQLISFGQDRVENASLHYNSLSTIFPSVLVHAIGDLIEGSEQYKSTKPVEQENTDREENAVTSPADTPAFPATLCSLKILIAEDNLVNQKVLKRLLNRIGVVNVEIVDNGKNAVDREAVEPFDMILMDMQMPVMDGTTACREILKRGDVGHPRPKIVFVTAHVSESFKEMCLAEGAVGYLPKPITVTSLKDTLEMYK
jgi:two-component system sensor histidine kinase/response regulator